MVNDMDLLHIARTLGEWGETNLALVLDDQGVRELETDISTPVTPVVAQSGSLPDLSPTGVDRWVSDLEVGLYANLAGRYVRAARLELERGATSCSHALVGQAADLLLRAAAARSRSSALRQVFEGSQAEHETEAER